MVLQQQSYTQHIGGCCEKCLFYYLKPQQRVGEIADKSNPLQTVTILHTVRSFNSIALISRKQKQAQILVGKSNIKKEDGEIERRIT